MASEHRPWRSLVLWFAIAAGLSLVAAWLIASWEDAPAGLLLALPGLAIVFGITRAIGRRSYD